MGGVRGKPQPRFAHEASVGARKQAAHIVEKKCPAGVCKALVRFEVDPEACKGCGICKKNCPSDAIRGEKKEAHVIDADACVTCGVCYEDCPFDAIVAT